MACEISILQAITCSLNNFKAGGNFIYRLFFYLLLKKQFETQHHIPRSFFMSRSMFSLFIVTLFSAILVTMFISAIVTFLSLEQKSLFISIWPKNWLIASIVGFFAILSMRPIAVLLGKKATNIFYGKQES